MTITSLANRSYQLYTINSPDTAERNVASPANIQQSTSLADIQQSVFSSATNEGFAQPIACPESEYEQQGPKRITATTGDQEKIGHRGEQHRWQPVAAVANRIFSILQLAVLLICFLVFVSPLLSSSD